MLGEDLHSLLCVGTSLLSLEWGFFPLSFDPSSGTASIGELRERCEKIGCAGEREEARERLFICWLIFVRVPKEKRENKEPR